MSEPFLGEIKIFGGNFAPRGYAICQGQILPIAQNTALFSLLGTQYGGNGTSNFGLPNFQAAAPMGQGAGPGLTPRVVGETGGSPTVTLLTAEMPVHSHGLVGVAAGGATSPGGNLLGGVRTAAAYSTPAAGQPMAPASCSFTGSGQPHNNLQQYLVLTMIIALAGIFPARN